jgi:hypothetical protein
MLVNILYIEMATRGLCKSILQSHFMPGLDPRGGQRSIGLSGTVMLIFFLQKIATMLVIIFIQRAQTLNVIHGHILPINKIGVAVPKRGEGGLAESKENMLYGTWDPMPELTITSPYVYSNTFTMGNPMPESTLSAQPGRDFGFGDSHWLLRWSPMTTDFSSLSPLQNIHDLWIQPTFRKLGSTIMALYV